MHVAVDYCPSHVTSSSTTSSPISSGGKNTFLKSWVFGDRFQKIHFDERPLRRKNDPLLNTHGYVWTGGKKKRSKLQEKLYYFREKRLKTKNTNRALENCSVFVSKTFNKYFIQMINISSIINITINKYIRSLLKYRGK